ncbi:hypothetical protein [Fimbriiglobus ruber]|uniref:hypothetical protein n=1 Tax=Fimbriiglobus ruber TaxID=1908690 RepID=UPI000B4C01C5|nr:hypothetical protein [Fimbriiglobus ruber]
MNPLQLSAQFSAYIWFLKNEENVGRSREEARQFSRLNWEKFLGVSDEGFGRLLISIGTPVADEGEDDLPLPTRRSSRVAHAVA